MTIQQDTIFVQGLPTDIDEVSLSQYFGQIGIIKVRVVLPFPVYRRHYLTQFYLFITYS